MARGLRMDSELLAPDPVTSLNARFALDVIINGDDHGTIYSLLGLRLERDLAWAEYGRWASVPESGRAGSGQSYVDFVAALDTFCGGAGGDVNLQTLPHKPCRVAERAPAVLLALLALAPALRPEGRARARQRGIHGQAAPST